MGTEQQGFQGTGTPFIQPRHWVVHHPIFTKHPKAMVVYMRLRTAFYEGDDQIRVMTNEQIADMVDLPVSTVRDALRYLTSAGLLVRINPEKKNAIPVRRFVDDLPEGYTGITNGLRHRDAVLNPVTVGSGSDETDNVGDGSSTPPSDQGIFPDEEISAEGSDEVKTGRLPDQDFYRDGNDETDNREFLGDGSSAPGDGSSTPGADLPSPNDGKNAGQDAWPGHQETTNQEATEQETHTPATPEAALPRGESDLRPVSEAAEELARMFLGTETEEDQAAAVALPGGGALVKGEVLGWSATWDQERNEEDSWS